MTAEESGSPRLVFLSLSDEEGEENEVGNVETQDPVVITRRRSSHEEQPIQPIDKYNAVYFGLVLAGIGFLLPYNR